MYPMGLNFYKNIIPLFLVTAFILLRVVNAHAFSHFSDDDQETHCELCEIITTSNQLTPFINNNFDEIEKKSTTDYKEYTVHIVYETPEYSVTRPRSVYNKPPPSKR